MTLRTHHIEKYKSLEPFDNSSFDLQDSWSKNSQDEHITMREGECGGQQSHTVSTRMDNNHQRKK